MHMKSDIRKQAIIAREQENNVIREKNCCQAGWKLFLANACWRSGKRVEMLASLSAPGLEMYACILEKMPTDRESNDSSPKWTEGVRFWPAVAFVIDRFVTMERSLKGVAMNSNSLTRGLVRWNPCDETVKKHLVVDRDLVSNQINIQPCQWGKIDRMIRITKLTKLIDTDLWTLFGQHKIQYTRWVCWCLGLR